MAQRGKKTTVKAAPQIPSDVSSADFYAMVGDNLRRYREHERLTQQKVADLLSKHLDVRITQNQISGHENAKRTPSLFMIRYYCQIYSRPWGDILGQVELDGPISIQPDFHAVIVKMQHLQGERRQLLWKIIDSYLDFYSEPSAKNRKKGINRKRS
jgi:transcriptional regulator with XRE-family HTH domain